MTDLLTDIVNVVVSSNVAAISQAGFRSMLHIGEFATSVFPERLRRYAGVSEVAEDFATTSAVYKAAQAAFSDPNDIHVEVFAVGRRVPGTAQEHEVAVTAPTSGAGTIALEVDGVEFAAIDIDAGTSDDDAATALAAAVNENAADHPFVATVATDTVTLVSQYGANEYAVTSTVTGTATAAAVSESVSAAASAETIADVLNAIELVDDDFFGITMTSTRQADATGLAAWLQSHLTKRVGAVRLNDPDADGALDASSTTDTAYVLANGSYSQIASFFHPSPWTFPDVRAMGGRLGVDPDEQATTWAHYQMSGISPYRLSTTHRSALNAKHCNHYVVAGGRGTILEGVLADGEFIDIAVSEAWIQARVRERVFGKIAGAVAGGGKLGYDDGGAKVLEAELRGVMSDAIDAGHVIGPDEDETLGPVFHTPRRSTIASATAATREYPEITCDAYWKGAIHRANFRVTMTV